MPDISQEEINGASTYETCLTASLRQENMILNAEKQNLQTELVFYKNELAKLCLKTGAKFPVFRPPEVESCTTSS